MRLSATTSRRTHKFMGTTTATFMTVAGASVLRGITSPRSELWRFGAAQEPTGMVHTVDLLAAAAGLALGRRHLVRRRPWRVRRQGTGPVSQGVRSRQSSADVAFDSSPARERSDSSFSSARSPGAGGSLCRATGGVGAVIVCGSSEPGWVLGCEPGAWDVFALSSEFAISGVCPPLPFQTPQQCAVPAPARASRPTGCLLWRRPAGLPPGAGRAGIARSGRRSAPHGPGSAGRRRLGAGAVTAAYRIWRRPRICTVRRGSGRSVPRQRGTQASWSRP
ncbi:hypothetical protein EDD99_6127 [Streptomyces sp. 846.5]|nr:hypothetical protein EDD99_6127 [Streptomyces sp. 846.5]